VESARAEVEPEKPSERESAELSEDLKAVLRQAAEAEKRWPHAKGIILLDEGTYELRADGTRRYRYHFIGKVLSNKTKGWASRQLYFEESRSRIRILKARSLSPEGRISRLDRKDIVVAAPSLDADSFSTEKVLGFVVPSVVTGSIVEYEYETDTFNPWEKKVFEAGFYFRSDEPVVMSRLRVVLPADKAFNYATRNMPPGGEKPEIKKEKDRIRYLWEVANQDPIIDEPNMPGYSDISPQVQGCIFKDWSFIFDWGKKIARRRMTVTPEIEALAKKLTEGAANVHEKIARIYHFIQEHIRYVSIKGSMSSSWSGHPASHTLKNRYGDCVDKAILFATMLKVIGVEAYPVTVRTNDSGTAIRDIPIFDANHSITEIHLNGKVFYLDSTTSNYRYPYFWGADQDISVVNELTGKIGRIPLSPPEHNSNTYRMAVRIQPDGRSAVTVRGRYTGDYEAGIRWYWKHVREEEREKEFQQHVNSISPGARLTSFTLHNLTELAKPLGQDYSYEIPVWPVFAADLMIFGIPGVEYSFDEVALARRRYPIHYETSRRTKHDVEIFPPGGWEIKYLPKQIDLSCPYASYRASYTLKDGVIHFSDDFVRTKRVVPVGDYETYRAFLQKVSTYPRRQIFLVRKAGTK
jgi:transglutaminase-like putative cysteine protease